VITLGARASDRAGYHAHIDGNGDNDDTVHAKAQVQRTTLAAAGIEHGGELATGTMEGPSFALAYQLAATDHLTDVDLTGGLTVAATGALSSGTSKVHAVGFVDEKIRVAGVVGADVVFVPEDMGYSLPEDLAPVDVDALVRFDSLEYVEAGGSGIRKTSSQWCPYGTASRPCCGSVERRGERTSASSRLTRPNDARCSDRSSESGTCCRSK
jgi:hypothetical protein